MKTFNVIAPLLLGSLAAAAPVNKRDLYTKTELVVETVVITTTVWEGEAAAAATTTSAGLFYEQPSEPASSAAQPTSTSAYVPPAPEPTSSIYGAPTSTVAPQPETSAPAYTPPAVPSSQAPVPSSPAYTPPSPASSAPPAASSSAPSGTPSSGEVYEASDITVYDTYDTAGMCGEVLHDTDMIVALAADMMGQAQFDVMTGATTNYWCGKKIEITYNGNSIEATIMDRCEGCPGASIDLTRSAMKALVGSDATERYKGATWKAIG